MKNAINLTVIAAALLSGCGNTTSTDSLNQSQKQGSLNGNMNRIPQAIASAVAKTQPARKSVGMTAADYDLLATSVFVAYFGRPPNSTGVAFWETSLLNMQAPVGINDFVSQYPNNAQFAGVLQGFSNSTEYQYLYGTSTTQQFVTSIFQNVFGRAPLSAGLTFWSNAIDSGTLTRAGASMSLMQGALAQIGSSDALTVNNKLQYAMAFTASLTPAQSAAYGGEAANAVQRAILNQITSTTDMPTFLAANIPGYTGGTTNPGQAGTIVASFVAEQTLIVGPNAIVTLDPSASSDSNGSINTYYVNWGDGHTSTQTTNAIMTHTYGPLADPDTPVNIALTVTDSNGTTATQSEAFPVALRIGEEYDGLVTVEVPVTNQIVGLTTTMIVPAEPTATGVLAIWPGLQPVNFGSNAANYKIEGNGLLQPILVWGGVGQSNTPLPYTTWWVEGYYYGQTVPSGGSVMPVSVGDTLQITMTLNGTVWTQTILDVTTNQSVSYSNDLHGQNQNLVDFAIEEHTGSQGPQGPVAFTNSTITLANPETGNWCDPAYMGSVDSMTVPTISADTKTCSISTVTLKEGPNPFKPL